MDIRRFITEKLNALPLKIIGAAMYGSWAKGTQDKESDIDILVVSDEINPRRHRRGKEIATIKQHIALGDPLDILLLTSMECISNFKNHNPLFLDIAEEGVILLDENKFLSSLIEETRKYISEKELEKLDDGWKFPMFDKREIFLSEVSNKDFAIEMFTDGKRDFSIGEIILEKGYFDKAVYHFQQSVEKSVKAILICFGIFKKTHFVGNILLNDIKERKVEDKWKEKLMEIAVTCAEIEPEVTWSRYPGIDEDTLWVPSREYSKYDAEEIKEKCKKTVQMAREFVEWWFKGER